MMKMHKNAYEEEKAHAPTLHAHTCFPLYTAIILDILLRRSWKTEAKKAWHNVVLHL